jgi:hypothetical protein
MSAFSGLTRWFLVIAGGIVTPLLVSIGAPTALGAEPPGEIVLDQQLIHQLRLFEKEIARSQYTEFCATVTMPPRGVLEKVEEASRAGDENAQVLFMWVFRLMERYKENGCGDRSAAQAGAEFLAVVRPSPGKTRRRWKTAAAGPR